MSTRRILVLTENSIEILGVSAISNQSTEKKLQGTGEWETESNWNEGANTRANERERKKEMKKWEYISRCTLLHHWCVPCTTERQIEETQKPRVAIEYMNIHVECVCVCVCACRCRHKVYMHIENDFYLCDILFPKLLLKKYLLCCDGSRALRCNLKCCQCNVSTSFGFSLPLPFSISCSFSVAISPLSSSFFFCYKHILFGYIFSEIYVLPTLMCAAYWQF